MKIITRAAAALLIATTATACGDDSAEPEASIPTTMPTAEWVAEFDRQCAEMGATLSDPALSEQEFAEISATGIAEMRALAPPETLAAEASSLLEAIEATSTDLTLTDDEIAAYDEQFLAAATVLGVSDECLYGASG